MCIHVTSRVRERYSREIGLSAVDIYIFIVHRTHYDDMILYYRRNFIRRLFWRRLCLSLILFLFAHSKLHLADITSRPCDHFNVFRWSRSDTNWHLSLPLLQGNANTHRLLLCRRNVREINTAARGAAAERKPGSKIERKETQVIISVDRTGRF